MGGAVAEPVAILPIVPYALCAHCDGGVQRNRRGTWYHLDAYELHVPCTTPAPAA